MRAGELFHFFAPGGRGRALAALFRSPRQNGAANAKSMASEHVAQLGVVVGTSSSIAQQGDHGRHPVRGTGGGAGGGGGAHQVVLVIDGDAKIGSFFVDGVPHAPHTPHSLCCRHHHLICTFRHTP